MPGRGKITGRPLEGAMGQDEIAATTHPGKRDAGECAKAMAEHGPALERAGTMSERARHGMPASQGRAREGVSHLQPDPESHAECKEGPKAAVRPSPETLLDIGPDREHSLSRHGAEVMAARESHTATVIASRVEPDRQRYMRIKASPWPTTSPTAP